MATANSPLTRRTEPVAARDATTTRTEKGVSLARGPALILGTILLAAGLFFLYKAHSFPRFANFPNGTAHKDGSFFFGIFGANGWTGELTAVAGGLLLFGAAHHVLAKTMSLIVGIALGAAAIIAVVSGNVLGMAGVNGWTELGWGISAAILLFNSLIPRRTRTIEEPVGAPVTEDRMAGRGRQRDRVAAEEAGAAGVGAGVAGERLADRHRRTSNDRLAANEPMMDDRTAVNEPTADDRMANDRMANDRMAGNGMAGNEPMMDDRTAVNEPMANDRMANDRMAGDGMANDRMAGNGMTGAAGTGAVEDPTMIDRGGSAGPGNAAGDETQMIDDRPRRFQRSDEMAGSGNGADNPAGAEEDQAATGHRRSGGLVGLFRRD